MVLGRDRCEGAISVMDWKEEYFKLKSQVERLNRIGISLTSETNLDRLLNFIVKACRDFTNAGAGSLYLKEEDHLIFKVAQNDTLERRFPEKELFKPFKIPINKASIAGFVASTGDMLYIDDAYQLSEDGEIKFNKDFDLMMDYKTESILAVPMKDHQEEIIGVIQLINSIDNGNIIPFDRSYGDLILSLASQAAVAINNADLIAKMKQLFNGFVEYSASAIDLRSRQTGGHSRRVMEICILMAEMINEEKEGKFAGICFNEEEMEELKYAGWLHDIGKIAVRERVLEKATKLSPNRMDAIRERFEAIKSGILMGTSGRRQEGIESELTGLTDDLKLIEGANIPGYLSDEDINRLKALSKKSYMDLSGSVKPYLTEYEVENLCIRRGNLTIAEYEDIKSHARHTYEMLKKIPFPKYLSRIPTIAGGHHEMLDGSGYPLGLKNAEIPLQCRIMSIADIYDALTAADRPYKRAIPPEGGLKILKEMAEKGSLDKDLVDLFAEKLFPQLSQIASCAVSSVPRG